MSAAKAHNRVTLVAVDAAQAELWPLPSTAEHVLRPRTRLTVSQWADKHRVLQEGYAAEPGPWHTARVPYLAGPMDAFTEPGIKLLIVVKSAQVGGTEFINNCLGYAIDQDPGPVLYIYPTESDAREEVERRIAPLIEGSPRLRRHIRLVKWQRGSNIRLDRMAIKMAWARSARTLLRAAARYVFFDEVDNCEVEAGNLGSPAALAQERLTTYGEFGKMVLNSTLSSPDATAHRMFLSSDRRRYHVPCPACGAYQTLKFAQIKVPEGMRDSDRILAEDLAWYECEGCGAHLTDREHKRWMVERGVWVPEAQRIVEELPVGDPGTVARAVFDHAEVWRPRRTGELPPNPRAGFHIWSAYSPWRSWSQIIAKFFEARHSPHDFRVFVNSWLGEPYEEVVDSIQATPLAAKIRKGLPRAVVPTGALGLVWGCDVQQDRVYWVLRAFGVGSESWLVDHGCTAASDPIEALEMAYTHVAAGATREEGGVLQPVLGLIDSGWRTQDIYEFTKLHPQTAPSRGRDKADWFVKPTRVEYSPRGTVQRRSVKLVHVNTSMAKETLTRMAHNTGNGPGVLHLHRETDEEWVAQFTAEYQVKRKGKFVWIPRTANRANHYLDAEVYALGAAQLMGLLGRKPTAPTVPTAEDQEQSPRRLGRGPIGMRCPSGAS